MNWIRSRDGWDNATAILLAAFAVLAVLTFRDYGVTWDEQHSSVNGRHFLNWYVSGFRDRTVIDDDNQQLYGSFFNALSTFVADHSPFGPYETGHLVVAVTALLGIVFAYRLGKLLAGSMAGFLSALLLTLTPSYYGHSFMNPKDLPFAVLFLISLYYMMRAWDYLPRLGLRRATVLGLAIGLTLGVRVGAILLFGYFVVLVRMWLVAKYGRNHGYRGGEIRMDLRAALASMIQVGLIAWVVMIVWWPYGQLSPLLNPVRAFRRASNDWPGTTLYRGEIVTSGSPAWHYLPTWFLITLPEFYAVVLLLGLTAVVIRKVLPPRGREEARADIQSKVRFLLFAILFPLVTAVVMRVIVYDAYRHFLFVIPPLAILTGVTLKWLLSGSLPRPLKLVTAFLVALSAAATVVDMARLHPYEYIFFNRSFGGLKAALGRYETEYWGESHKEGIDWLVRNYRPAASAGSIHVANTAAAFQTGYYLRRNPDARRFLPVDPADGPDVMISMTRGNMHLKHPGKVLHVVERMGTPLLYVVEVSKHH